MFTGWFFSKKAESKLTKGEEKKPTLERLRKRAKELTEVDHSWRSTFECLGFENARKHAGFTDAEIKSIELQLKADRKELLKDENYLRERSYQLKVVDSSWTSYLFGPGYARRNAGFKWDEINAIEKQREIDDAAMRARHAKSFIKSFFSSDDPKKANPPSHKETDAIRERQAERRLSLRSAAK